MSAKTNFKTRLGFGAGEFSSAIFFTVTSFWLLNFLTDEVRLSAALAGTALLIGKVWDAVIDPFIGYISDRTRSRWGRRRPYLLIFAIPFGLAFFFLFKNPGIADQTGKFIWALLVYTLLSTAYSFANIPYNALLPELTDDYHERTQLSGFKQIFAVLGTLLGAGAALPLIGLFGTRTAGFAGMAAVFGGLGAISLLVTFFTVKEPAYEKPPVTTGLIKSLGAVFTNRPFVLLLASWITNTTGIAVIETMLVYYYKYVFNREDGVTFAMIALLVVAIVCIPVWIWFSKKIGKKNAYLLGMSVMLVVVLAFSFGGQLLGVNGALVLMVIAGFGISAHYVLPWSMAPDAIDYDFKRSGVRREGVYYSLWTFFTAVGGALAGFLVGQGLGLFGYVADVAQTPTALLGIRILTGPIPAVLFLLGNLAVFAYPLTQQFVQKIAAENPAD